MEFIGPDVVFVRQLCFRQINIISAEQELVLFIKFQSILFLLEDTVISFIRNRPSGLIRNS
jgi:hypothetical protein